ARRFAFSEHERTDAVRIAEPEQAVPHDHRDDRESAAHAAIKCGHRIEDVRSRRPGRACTREFAREHVQEHFGVGARVEMPQVFPRENLGELTGVRQVAVVAEADAVRRIYEEGLGFRGGIVARGRIPYVADTDVALEREHVALLEDIANEPGLLAQEELAVVIGHDAGGVLTAMLEDGQRIIDLLVSGRMTDDSDDTALYVNPSTRIGRYAPA